ncbi:hypothetical protein F5Y05DRAFT_380440, partial [Hypoxylon sp. FL0543]
MSQSDDRTERCDICQGMVNVVALTQAPCGHIFCHPCLRQLFRLAVSHESRYPAHCCFDQIPLEPFIPILGADLVRQYRAKTIEYTTHPRVYCHRRECSAFIPPDDRTGSEGRCPACQARTCIDCKGPSHAGDCPRDYTLERVLALAQENGWRRCPNCQTMVERKDGCDHM